MMLLTHCHALPPLRRHGSGRMTTPINLRLAASQCRMVDCIERIQHSRDRQGRLRMSREKVDMFLNGRNRHAISRLGQGYDSDAVARSGDRRVGAVCVSGGVDE